MKALKHHLFSENEDMPIAWFEKFDKDEIKTAIIKHLTEHPNDILEHCKELNDTVSQLLGQSEILGFYEINPTNKRPSRIVMKGNKKYYKSLTV